MESWGVKLGCILKSGFNLPSPGLLALQESSSDSWMHVFQESFGAPWLQLGVHCRGRAFSFHLSQGIASDSFLRAFCQNCDTRSSRGGGPGLSCVSPACDSASTNARDACLGLKWGCETQVLTILPLKIETPQIDSWYPRWLKTLGKPCCLFA